jgi:Gpi16 subunit, GPI transamidase component
VQGQLDALPSPDALVHASQHVLGSGDEDGTWLLELQRSTSQQGPLLVCAFSAIPWYFQVWLHTLQIEVDGRVVPLKQVRTTTVHVHDRPAWCKCTLVDTVLNRICSRNASCGA